MHYPKWIYRGAESRIVQDAVEHAQFPGWTESPAAEPAEPVETEKPRRGRPRKEQ